MVEGYNDIGYMVPALVNRGLSSNYLDVDTVQVLLADSADPTVVLDSAKALMDIYGEADLIFKGSVVGHPYYLVVRTINTIETWSAQPIMMGSQTYYDFTDASSKAYGSNMFEVEPGIWGFFSGELNYDGFVDPFDYSIFENDNLAFAYGYNASDLNGDGYTDPFDSQLIEKNNMGFVTLLRP
jgi:hypothetical protein